MTKRKKGTNEKFFVCLIPDVLFEVLCFGTRGRLAKLEIIGRRLDRLINGSSLVEKPFLCLNLSWYEFILLLLNRLARLDGLSPSNLVSQNGLNS